MDSLSLSLRALVFPVKCASATGYCIRLWRVRDIVCKICLYSVTRVAADSVCVCACKSSRG